MIKFERVIIIRDKTRLEQLIEKFNSKAQAKFYIEKSGSDFDFYINENNTFYKSFEKIKKVISKHLKFKIVDRYFLSTYIFTEKDLIVVIGQDGLLANTAKYVKTLPIIGINPDIERYDGVLLKHNPETLNSILKNVISNKFKTEKVTMAKATLNDGQTLLAFNDFYIGANSHVSSRYIIDFNGKTESQSSSGIIVSTGAGSTGWLSSIFNMVNNFKDKYQELSSKKLNWNANKLIFVVREPFLSKTSKTDIAYGIITNESTLKIESNMPNNGVIFSDGIESDFLNFNSGSIVEIGISNEKANLVV